MFERLRQGTIGDFGIVAAQFRKTLFTAQQQIAQDDNRPLGLKNRAETVNGTVDVGLGGGAFFHYSYFLY